MIVKTNDKKNNFENCLNINLWLSSVKIMIFHTFLQSKKSIIDLNIDQKIKWKYKINEHLLALFQNLQNYFPSLSTIEMQWVVSSYGLCEKENIENANLSSKEKDNLLEISSKTMLKSAFYESQINSFWSFLQNNYSEVSKKALWILTPYSTLYMCESAFSIL